jgi:serine/threonine protein kinase
VDPHKAMVVGDVVTGLCGAYRVEARHGEGAFGVTYRATEVATRASVILKELRIERLDDWKALELFEREGRVLASLSHPNIPAFRDSFVHGGAIPLPVSALSSDDAPERSSLILVQELIEGATLQHRIDRGERLSPTEAEGVLRALLGALDYLHGRNPPLVHRDVKPSNVVMSSTGRPSLVDFGAIQDRLGKAGARGSTIVGTVGYMPLEQIRGDARPASDLYALGVTLVVALAGRPLSELPFDDASGRISVTRAVPPETPHVLRRVLESMTAPLLGQRLQSAAEALSQLAATPNRARAIRSHALAAIVGAAVASAAVVGLFTAGKPNGARPSQPPEPARSEPAPLPQQVPPIPEGNMGGDRPACRSVRSPASVAPDSVEGQLRAKGKHWTQSGGELHPGDYVEDILVGRLNQPAGRGDIAKVLSVSRGKGSGGEMPAAFVDFGRGHSVGIFTTELSRIRFVD